jgi:uncharacterized protein (TIGR03067 family)
MLAVAILAMSSWAAAQDQKKQAEPEAASLAGTYRITAGQVGKAKIPAEHLKDDRVTITDRTISVFDKNRKETYAATYSLDKKKTPWVLHMTSTVAPSPGVKSEGLVGKDGSTLKLIYALPGGKAPDDFEPEEKQQLFVLERQAQEKSTGGDAR